MNHKITQSGFIVKLLMVFTIFTFFTVQLDAQTRILNNNRIRVGNGVETSINASGTMQQPFYYSSVYTAWRKLTYSTYPLDIRWGVGGDGTNSWNINGTMQDNPSVTSPVYDFTGFTVTNVATSEGYGTIIFTGQITIGGQNFAIENTYTLLQPEGYIKTKVKLTNISATTATNVRLWVGTRDDWVGATDSPTKERGNIVGSAFVMNTTTAQQAKAIKIFTGDEAVMFFSNSSRAYSTIASCCSFTNATNSDPSTNLITATDDGSYALYVRFNDLNPGQSDELVWYYAAGSLADINNIIAAVAANASAVANITDTSADFSYSATQSGTTSYIMVPSGSTAPTAAQVAAGVNYPGASVLSASTVATTANVNTVFPLTGLSQNTSYSVYAVTYYFDGVSWVYSGIQNANFTTLRESVPPTAICQNITIPLNVLGNATITAAQIDNGSNDAFGILSLSVSPSAFTCANVGNNTVTLTVTDNNFNVSTCTATVTVQDVTPPTAICQNATVQLNASGTITIAPALVNNGSNDVCGIATLSVSPSTFTCANVGNNTVTLTVTDANGLVSTCTSTVTVQDITPPVAICQPLTVVLNAVGTASITAAQIDNGSSDACGIASMSVLPSTFNCSNIGANTVTLTVTDNNGLVSTCTSTVTVQGLVAPPVALCKPLTVQLNSSGTVTITGAQIDNGSNAVCGIASLVASPSTFTCANKGANTVTLTVTDIIGNTSTCTSIVTVQDVTPPTAICQNITVPLDASGNVTIVAAQVNNGSNDACGLFFVGLDKTEFNCSNIGANTVTLGVIDNSFNSSSCTATVTIVDTTVPIAICQPQTIQLDAFGNASITAAQINNGSYDVCGAITMSVSPSSFTCANIGANTVTLTVTDAYGNSSSCSTTVMVQDQVAPIALCQNITVPLNASGSATITAAQIDNGSYDVCGGAVTLSIAPITFTCANIGASNVVTLTVTDFYGNASTCTANVTVIDNLPPVALCKNVTIQLDATGNASIVAADINNGSTDNCGIFFIGVTPNTFTCADVGVNTVTLGVIDNYGNNASCTATVTVEDNIDPVITCPSNVAVNTDAGVCGAAVTYAVTATDNCGSTSSNLVLNGSFESGFTNWVISNGTGSISCGQPWLATTVTTPCLSVPAPIDGPNAAITAFDGDGPTTYTMSQSFVVPMGLTSANLSWLQAYQMSYSNLPRIFTIDLYDATNTTLISNVNTQTLPYIGNMPWTPFNANLLSILSTQAGNAVTLRISAYVPEFYTGPAAFGMDKVALDINTSSTIITQTSGLPSGSIFPVGITTNAFLATDPSGNTDSCTFTVTVEDHEAPEAICQNITVQLDATGNVVITADQVDNGSNDACGIESLSVTPDTFDCSHVGDNTVVLTVTDIHGNVSTCNAVVTVEDTVLPEALCEASVSELVNTVTVTPGLPIASNATFTSTLEITDAVLITDLNVNLNINHTWTSDVTLKLTSPTGTQITIFDNGCSGDNIMVTLDDEATNLLSTCLTPLAYPNSPYQPFTALSAYDGQNAAGIWTLTVTDNVTGDQGTLNSWGLTYTTLQSSSVINLVLDDLGTATLDVADVDAGSNDACGIQSMTISQTDFDCEDVGANVVILTVTDNNGNVATCSSLVQVIDNTLPEAICQNITVDLDSSGHVTILGSQVDNGSNDACGIASLVVSPDVFDCSHVGDNPVVLTVTDNNGNVATCNAIVTVEDNVSPDVICISAESVVSNTASTSPALSIPDNNLTGVSSVINISENVNISDLNVAVNISHTWVGDLIVSLQSPAGTSVVLIDRPGYTGSGAGCANNNVVAILDDEASSAVETQCSSTPPAINGTFIPNNLLSAFDGESSMGNWTLTILDRGLGDTGILNTWDITYSVSTPISALDVVLDADGNAAIEAEDIDAGSTDACGIASMSVSPSEFTCANVGENTVTLTVVDVNGNESTCTSIITVIDNIAPEAICQNITVQLDDTGNASITASQVDNGSNDACGIESLVVTPNTFDCSHVGDNTVTLTVTDVNGNVSTCNSVVTIEDNVAPIAICIGSEPVVNTVNISPALAIPDNNVSGVSSVFAVTENVDLTDLNVALNINHTWVGDVIVSLQSPAGTTVVLIDRPGYTGTGFGCLNDNIVAVLDDEATNPVESQCSSTPPAINGTFIPNNALSAFDGENTLGNWTLTVSDRVGGDTGILNSWGLTFASEPTPLVLQLDVNGSVTLDASAIDAGSNDACGIASITVSPNEFTCANVGENQVTLTVTDVNGNESTCTSTVVVEDNVAPEAICQNITVELDNTGNASITATQVDNGSNDACGIESIAIDLSSFTCEDVGENTVVLTVTDVNGNVSTCTSTVTVEDNIAPVALCQNLTVELDASGNASITAAQVDNGSSDACGIESLVVLPSTFDCSNVGENTVILTVTDVNGNTSTCESIVTVEDNTAPVVLCSNITVQLDGEGMASITPANFQSVLTISSNIEENSSPGFTDFEVNIVQGMTVTFDWHYTTPDGPEYDTFGYLLNGAYTELTTIAGGNNQMGTTSVLVAPGDVFGFRSYSLDNIAGACTTTVNNFLPGFNGQFNQGNWNLTLENSNGNAYFQPIATDACGIESIELDVDEFTCENIGDNTVTITATDVNGNEGTCVAIVTVEDNVAPVPDDIHLPLLADYCMIEMPETTATDNCSGQIIGVPNVLFPITEPGTVLVTWTYEDPYGNISTQTQYMMIYEPTDPTMQDVDSDGDGYTNGEELTMGSDPCDICSPGPASPTGPANQIFCSSEYPNPTFADLDVTPDTGNGINFYDAGGNEYMLTDVLVSGVYTITQTNENDCESMTGLVVNVTVSQNPEAPVAVSPQVFCSNDEPMVSDLEITGIALGTTLTWYSDIDLTVEIPVTTSLVDGTTYYVTQTNMYGCESDPAAITAIISITPEAPVTEMANQLFCSADYDGVTFGDIEVTADEDNQLHYYDAGGNEYDASDELLSGTYFITQENEYGCESVNSLVVNVIVSQTPAAPQVETPQLFCSVDQMTVGDLEVTPMFGTYITWYDGEGNVLTANTLLQTATYYVSQTNADDCESALTAVQVVVTPTPGAPTGAATQTFCASDFATVSDLTATPTSPNTVITWYDAVGNPIAGTTALQNGVHYFATQTSAAAPYCEGVDKLDVTVVIVTLAEPTGDTYQEFCVGDEATVGDLIATVASGNTYVWYDAAENGSLLSAGTLLHDGVYYAETVNQLGCTSLSRLAVQVSLDTDCDDDGVWDVQEVDGDTDTDGTVDYLDNDDDGDGVLTFDEDSNTNGDWFDDDCNENGVVDYLDPQTCDFIPNAFSPNGDGDNDVWVIPGLAQYPDFTLEIYDRWGNIVLDYKNAGRTTPDWWDGISSGRWNYTGGEVLPTGTYFYIINYNEGTREPSTGWVYLQNNND